MIFARNALACITLLCLFPLQIQAIGSQPISRGEFLRLLVSELHVPVDRSVTTTDFVRVPRSYVPLVEALDERKALAVFKDTIAINRSVTRIEAARVLVELLGLNSSKQVRYRDVSQGTLEQRAVQVVVERGFLPPLREGYFGADRLLTEEDAYLLVGKATGRYLPTDTGSATPVISEPTEGKIYIQTPATIKASKVTTPKQQLQDIVWQLLQEGYLYEDRLDETELGYKAIEALVKAADDPYTTFLRPQDTDRFQTQIAGEITGIGAQVQDIDGYVTVVSPLPGSPAAQAGIRPNDRILAVDGESLLELQFYDAVQKVRGPRGSIAVFTVQRSGSEIEVSIKRDLVRVPDFETSFNGKIAIVTLSQFGQTTNRDLTKEMTEIIKANPTGIIVDLRNNPGGLLDAAGIAVGQFVPKGTVYAQIKTKDGLSTNKTTIEPTVPESVPLVVLINAGSASSSEIVAGALRDLNRAILVGETSFGKGTVQQVVQFTDSSSLKFTIAEWLTPNGRKIDQVGIEPEYQVEFDVDRDNALLKALDLLR